MGRGGTGADGKVSPTSSLVPLCRLTACKTLAKGSISHHPHHPHPHPRRPFQDRMSDLTRPARRYVPLDAVPYRCSSWHSTLATFYYPLNSAMALGNRAPPVVASSKACLLGVTSSEMTTNSTCSCRPLPWRRSSPASIGSTRPEERAISCGPFRRLPGVRHNGLPLVLKNYGF